MTASAGCACSGATGTPSNAAMAPRSSTSSSRRVSHRRDRVSVTAAAMTSAAVTGSTSSQRVRSKASSTSVGARSAGNLGLLTAVSPGVPPQGEWQKAELGGMPSAIVTRALSKSFGDIVALDGLDLDVPAGTVFGLLGPDGAGKTTAVRLLLGLLLPSYGSIEILGEVLRDPGDAVLANVGAIVDGPAFVPHATGRDNLELWRLARRTKGIGTLRRAGAHRCRPRRGRGRQGPHVQPWDARTPQPRPRPPVRSRRPRPRRADRRTRRPRIARDARAAACVELGWSHDLLHVL